MKKISRLTTARKDLWDSDGRGTFCVLNFIIKGNNGVMKRSSYCYHDIFKISGGPVSVFLLFLLSLRLF